MRETGGGWLERLVLVVALAVPVAAALALVQAGSPLLTGEPSGGAGRWLEIVAPGPASETAGARATPLPRGDLLFEEGPPPTLVPPTSLASARPSTRSRGSSPPPAAPTPVPTARPKPTPAAHALSRAQREPRPAAAAGGAYTVQRGDELRHIAAQHGLSVWDLIAVNDIPNPDSLRVGQVLTIPSAGGAAPPQPASVDPVAPRDPAETRPAPSGSADTPPAAPAPAPPAPPPPSGGRTYTVQPGDQLKHVAARYGVDLWDLAAANGIANPDSLSAGQVLVIP